MSRQDHSFLDLKFDGGRYAQPCVDVDALMDIRTLMSLLQEEAIRFWKLEHPERQRIGKGFEQQHRIVFTGIQHGSTRVCLAVTNEDELVSEPPLSKASPFDQAAEKVATVLSSVQRGERLSDSHDREIARRLLKLGKSLAAGETLGISVAHSGNFVQVDSSTALRTARALEERFPTAVKTLVGRVVAVNMEKHTFTPVFDGVFDDAKEMSLPTDLEGRFIDALRQFKTKSLRMRCRVQLKPGGKVQSVLEVKAIEVLLEPIDRAAKSIDGQHKMAEIARQVRESHSLVGWDQLPPDLSTRTDEAWEQ